MIGPGSIRGHHCFFIQGFYRGLQAQCKGIRAWPKEIGSGPILVGVRGFKSLPLHHSSLIFRSFCSSTSSCGRNSHRRAKPDQMLKRNPHQSLFLQPCRRKLRQILIRRQALNWNPLRKLPRILLLSPSLKSQPLTRRQLTRLPY